jgi:hypothetical protein
VIAEGPTEVGFLRFLLKKAFAAEPLARRLEYQSTVPRPYFCT